MSWSHAGKKPQWAQILATKRLPTYIRLGVSYEIKSKVLAVFVKDDTAEDMWLYEVSNQEQTWKRFIFSPFDLPSPFWVRAVTGKAIRHAVLGSFFWGAATHSEIHYEILGEHDEVIPVHELCADRVARAPTLKAAKRFKVPVPTFPS